MLRIVRNDITKMETDAIVNTANDYPTVGTGCDRAVYTAAGYDKLLKYRTEKIGFVPEGEAFMTPGFDLPVQYIIHGVSPLYYDGKQGEEEKLRQCYRNCLRLAKENNLKSIAFPLISTGGFGYPKNEGIRIAVDEINAFLLENEMQIYLVVFDEQSVLLAGKLQQDLDSFIDQHYVKQKTEEEYSAIKDGTDHSYTLEGLISHEELLKRRQSESQGNENAFTELEDVYQKRLDEKLAHASDTFSQYLMYLIQSKKMDNAAVYNRALVDRKIFSKIKNTIDYHPQKLTALCLCIGAKLSMNESVDLLKRAGYAFSPSDLTDIIFAYFIENQIYDMIELDIQLEEHGLPCIIK